MSVCYSFVADWGFYRTAFARYKKQRPRRYWSVFALLGLMALASLAWAWGRMSNAWWTPVPEFTLIGGIIGAIVGGTTMAITARTILARRIRRSPSYGATISITLDDTGVYASEPHAKASLECPAFERVVRFPDGILLVRGRAIRWLPDAALQGSSPEQVVTFVRSKANLVMVG